MKTVIVGWRGSSVFLTVCVAFVSFKDVIIRFGEGWTEGTLFLGLWLE